MRTDIADAIRNRRRLHISYPPGERAVEPHVLGYGSGGQLLLRAFQTEGASESGDHHHWKLFRVDRVRSLSVGEEFHGTRPNYNPNDSAMTGGIIERL